MKLCLLHHQKGFSKCCLNLAQIGIVHSTVLIVFVQRVKCLIQFCQDWNAGKRVLACESKTMISAVVVDQAWAQPPELASNSRHASTKGAGYISRQSTHLCNVELTCLQLTSDPCRDRVRCSVGDLDSVLEHRVSASIGFGVATQHRKVLSRRHIHHLIGHHTVGG